MAAKRHRVGAIREHYRLFCANPRIVRWRYIHGHCAVQAGQCQNGEQHFHDLVHLGESPSRDLLRVAKYMPEGGA